MEYDRVLKSEHYRQTALFWYRRLEKWAVCSKLYTNTDRVFNNQSCTTCEGPTNYIGTFWRSENCHP